MNARTPLYVALLLAFSATALHAGTPAPGSQGRLAALLGKAAPNKEALGGNRFAALQTLAPNSAGKCAANLIAPGNGRKLWAIYMIGSDLESRSGYATTNMRQLVAGWKNLASRDGIDIVVAFGGAAKDGWKGVKYATIEQIAADLDDNVMGNAGNYLRIDERADMGQQGTFEDFLNFVNGRYGEASRKFLSFWDHGATYNKVPGIGPDENTRNVLDLTRINNGLASSGSCYHVIGFDACLMASMETAAAIKDFAAYLVASEELEPGHGWNYQPTLRAFAESGSLMGFARIMVDEYVKDENHAYRSSGKTLSVLDLAQAGAAMQALEGASQQLATSALADPQPLIRAFYGAQQYAGKLTVDPELIPSQVSIDLKDFLAIAQVRSTDSALRSSVGKAISAIDALVAYSRHDGSRPGSYGVAIAPLDIAPATINEQNQVGLVNDGWAKLAETYRGFAGKAGVPVLNWSRAEIPGAALTYLNDRDGSVDAGTYAAMRIEQGYNAGFSSPYLGEVRATFGRITSDGGLVVLGEAPTYAVSNGSHFAPQWNGQGLALSSAKETVYLPSQFTAVANRGLILNTIVAIQSPGENEPALGLMTIETDNEGTHSYAISAIEDLGFGLVTGRISLEIAAGDTVLFFATKLLPQGGSDIVVYDRVTFSESPKLVQRPYTGGNWGHTLVAYAVGDKAAMAPIQPVSAADRIFNWGASENPAFQLNADSQLLNGYYSRCNSAKTLCVGSQAGNLWFFDGKLLNLGGIDAWLGKAAAAGY